MKRIKPLIDLMFCEKGREMKVQSKYKNEFLKNSYVLISLFILISCGNTNNNEKTTSKTKNCSFSDSTKFAMLISATIELPKLQQYFGGSCREKQLIILNNQNFKGIEKLHKFGEPISLMTQKQIIDNQVVFYIKYEPIILKNDSAYVEYYYSGQNIEIKSTFVFENNQWNTVESILSEH